MPRAPHRHRRIESELQRTVSELLRREVKDPRIGMITIAAVKVSPDLKYAKFFYTSFDDHKDPREVQAGLQGAARFLRGQVGRLLKLRVAPELTFQLDEQLKEGLRLTGIIDAAVAADERRHADDPAAVPTNETPDDDAKTE